jgi:aspartate/methionine/tyrosine aminotransferase
VTTDFARFELERLLSTWENRVEYNLSESGVRSLAPRALLNAASGDELIDAELNYPQSNGVRVLRERIAALYPGAGPENVLVTVGASQANFTAFIAFTQPGDAVAVMQPNYQQIWGLAQNLGRTLCTFRLRPELDWQLDREELNAAVTSATKFVAIVNPNNPTGRILSSGERRAVIEAASRADAWLLADEVYAGAEHSGDVTPSFYGEYERVLAVGSLSKAYGLAGLRIGWIVGPSDAIERLWAWQDYITISTGMLDNRLAAIALVPEVRARLVERARDYVRRGFTNVSRWAASRQDVEVFPPQAAAICVVTYRHPVDSTQLVTRLIQEQSTLVAPGDLFGLSGCLRVSFGLADDYVNEGLRRIGETLDKLQ